MNEDTKQRKKNHKPPIFLTAKWKNLLFCNYIVDRDLLEPLVPTGTEIDLWEGNCYISLVAFQFLSTSIFHIPAITHRNFDEINLRFYVKKTLPNGDINRGVVFIKEIVPKKLIAWIAKTIYGEKYISLPMNHTIKEDLISYGCKNANIWNKITATIPKKEFIPALNDFESYITEHYWAYVEKSKGQTLEYEVEHPQWAIRNVSEYNIDINFDSLYGETYKLLNNLQPESIFFCEGSNVSVRLGKSIQRQSLSPL